MEQLIEKMDKLNDKLAKVEKMVDALIETVQQMIDEREKQKEEKA